LRASPKKNWSDVPGEHMFPFNAVLRQTRDGRQELFGRHVHIVFDPNTGLGRRAKLAVFFSESRMGFGRAIEPVPDSKLGLVLGDFFLPLRI
jgi:hypothetical protein